MASCLQFCRVFLQARIKVKDFLTIKALPEPVLRLQKRWRIGRSGLALRAAYELPLADAEHIFEPPARLLVRYGPCRAYCPRIEDGMQAPCLEHCCCAVSFTCSSPHTACRTAVCCLPLQPSEPEPTSMYLPAG